MASGQGDSRRFRVDDAFEMPDFADELPHRARIVTVAPVALRMTYYDTADLRLTRAHVGLWFMRFSGGGLDRYGDQAEATPWHLDLDGIGMAWPGAAGAVPSDLVAVLTAYTRGEPLGSVAVLRTSRIRYEILDAKRRPVAGLWEDRVSVLDGRKVRDRFRQVVLDTEGTDPDLVRRLARRLRKAGASERRYRPSLVRALGPMARRPPDLPPPNPAKAGPERGTATTADALADLFRSDIAGIIGNDPLVRLRMSVPAEADGRERHRRHDGRNPAEGSVHWMRAAVRRLRAHLAAFGRTLDRTWADNLRAELTWLGTALGEVRNAEVLRARLPRTAALDPAAPLDRAAIARIDADLAARHEEARHALDEALASPRYLKLLDTLLVAASDPPEAGAGQRPARRSMERALAAEFGRLATGGGTVPGARGLRPDDPDDAWHAVRRRAKNARYTAEAVAAVDDRATGLAHALADVSDVLGAHQDAVMAEHAWIAIATGDPDDHALAVTAGRLAERERADARQARARYPQMWAGADRGRLTKWLR